MNNDGSVPVWLEDFDFENGDEMEISIVYRPTSKDDALGLLDIITSYGAQIMDVYRV